MKQVKIRKEYSRTISQDYQSYKFAASMEETIEYATDEELVAKSSELFLCVRQMVENDIASTLAGVI